jgi:F-type H+-transporting ATPase subunit epsilon
LSYKQGATRTALAVSGGYAEVLDNVMTVLAPAAEFPAEIDTVRAQRAKERAERQLAEADQEEKNWAAAQAALQRALVRLQVASKEARR